MVMRSSMPKTLVLVGSFRISPNPRTKSVKENATKQPGFSNPETVFVRKQCCNVKSKTTLGNGYLSSRIDEERSNTRYLSLTACCAPSLLAEGTSAWVSQIIVPPSSRGYGAEADLPCVTARGWPKSELRTRGGSSHAVTDSKQVPLGKDEKDIEKRVKECLKLSGGKRMGAGDSSRSDAERSNPVYRSIRAVDRRRLRW
ncbi:hypothetical protein YC2023_066081 [Brassica napus]